MSLMKLKHKLYIIVFTTWIMFACGMYLINYFFFQETNLSTIKYELLNTLILSLLFTLFTLWFIVSFFSGELAKLEQKIDKEKEQFRLEHLQHDKHDQPKTPPIKLSYYDPLTDMPNRLFFNEILNKAINQAKRQDKTLAIFIIDLDNFKTINNRFGQSNADQILKIVSERFKTALRSSDMMAKSSGDEFIVLLDDINQPKFASPVAEKILQLCSQPLTIDDKRIKLTASIGIATFPLDGESMQDLEMHADIAMSKAKQLGGNGYQYYRHEMDIAAREHLRLENSIRKAIANHEFVLYYQPQLNLLDGKIKSVEALIRWNHPELGLISPEKFISFAEETDLIKAIGEWALQEACQTNKAWQIAGYDPIIIGVNISAKQFHYPDFIEMIKQTLRTSQLAPQYLEIEITESMMMKDMKHVVEKLHQLHDLGIQIAVDDFGTGYTSINYLKQFPLSALKIDQTFIQGIPFNENDAAITSSIITLGHNLGLRIVAEGVETTEQIQFLACQHCDLIQGYFLSRPLPAHKIILQFSKRGKTKEPLIET